MLNKEMMNEFRNNMKEKESGRYFKSIYVNKDESEIFVLIRHAMKYIFSGNKYISSGIDKKPLIVVFSKYTSIYDVYKIIHSIERYENFEFMVQRYEKLTTDDFADYMMFSEKMNPSCELSAVVFETDDMVSPDYLKEFGLTFEIPIYVPTVFGDKKENEEPKEEEHDIDSEHEKFMDEVIKLKDRIWSENPGPFATFNIITSLLETAPSLDLFFKSTFTTPMEQIVGIQSWFTLAISFSLQKYERADGDASLYDCVKELHDESTKAPCKILEMSTDYILNHHIHPDNSDQVNFNILKEFYVTFMDFIVSMDFIKYNDFLQPIIFDMMKFFTE